MHFHEPAISFLSIYPKEICIYSPKHTKGYFHQHDPFVSQTGNYSNEQKQKLKVLVVYLSMGTLGSEENGQRHERWMKLTSMTLSKTEG